ncbi:MAG: DUF1573 domain-containing protein [Flavobacteriales bacterium]|nr:DUF1573 domain-containing protein [Flavobacteriales bacterium]
MRKTFGFIAVLLLVISSCKMTNRNESSVSADMVTSRTTIAFEEDVFDFGEMTQGDQVSFEFEFINTGDSPLLILDVKPSCGCTISDDWPDHPIEPGEGGIIPVTFNSEGKKGHQSKSITLVANTTPRTTVLTIQGDVIAPGSNE